MAKNKVQYDLPDLIIIMWLTLSGKQLNSRDKRVKSLATYQQIITLTAALLSVSDDVAPPPGSLLTYIAAAELTVS